MKIYGYKRTISPILIYLPIVLVGLMLVTWWRSGVEISASIPLADYDLADAVYRTGADNDLLIENLQNRLLADSEDWQAYSQLGLAYLQKARETGDPTYYQKAEGVLEKSLSLEPDDYVSTSATGALALARHEFQTALDWGERARQINPNRPYAYGVIADAQIELGLYDEAVRTLQKMVDLRPDMGSYTRISYIRELHGDSQGALELMQWAVDSGSPNSENTAWTRTQMGNLFFNMGNLDQAEIEYLRTLKDHPGYVYSMAGLARIYIARGRTEDGIALLRETTQAMPVPEFIITLADALVKTGQVEAAQEQYDLLGVIEKLYQANGVDMDLEIALFNADHGLAASLTLNDVHEAYQRRPSIYAADVMAWVLYKSGRYEEARTYSEQALRLGTRDALKLFHAGMIHYQLGDLDQARIYLERAVEINPHFSILYSEEAQRILAELKARSDEP